MSDAHRTALVDESFRRGSDGKRYFLMAAVLVPDELHATITQRLRTYVAPGQRRWHFRDERPSSRRKFLAEVSQLHELEVVAVAFCCPNRCGRSAGSPPEQREGRGPVFRRGFPASLLAAQRCQHR